MISHARVLRNAGGTVVAIAFLVGTAAAAQSPEDALISKIKAIRYPPLAEQARIMGDVHLKLNSGVVTVVSGHPLLIKTAEESAKGFRSLRGTTDVEITYHFVLSETYSSVPTLWILNRGNAVERFFLRTFGRQTKHVVVRYECLRGDNPPTDVEISGSVIEIWVYGRAACLNTVPRGPALTCNGA